MVILPFYSFLIGTAEKNRTQYAFLSHDGRCVPIDIAVRFPSYHANSQSIYGIWTKNGKDVIGRAKLQPGQTDFSPLFSLSDKKLSHIAISPDNQRIAFLAAQENSRETQLRVIAHEEFGWFPLPFIRLPAAQSPISFCSSDILLYTDTTGALSTVRLAKPVKTVGIHHSGRCPAYNAQDKSTAFISGTNIIVSNKIQEQLKATSQTILSFSKNGKELLFTKDDALYRYTLSDQQRHLIFQASAPITFIAEL